MGTKWLAIENLSLIPDATGWDWLPYVAEGIDFEVMLYLFYRSGNAISTKAWDKSACFSACWETITVPWPHNCYFLRLFPFPISPVRWATLSASRGLQPSIVDVLNRILSGVDYLGISIFQNRQVALFKMYRLRNELKNGLFNNKKLGNCFRNSNHQ